MEDCGTSSSLLSRFGGLERLCDEKTWRAAAPQAVFSQFDLMLMCISIGLPARYSIALPTLSFLRPQSPDLPRAA